jgi:hypothetical protein
VAPIVPVLVTPLRETRAALGEANVIGPLVGQLVEAPTYASGLAPAGAGAGADAR